MLLKLSVFVICLEISTLSAASVETSEPATESAIVVEVSELMNSGKIEYELFDCLKNLVMRLKAHVDALVDQGAVTAGIADFLRVCEIISPAFDTIPEALKDEGDSVEATLELIADYINLHQYHFVECEIP